MKELLKKASLTVATACLVAGGLVSVGWAYSGKDSSKRLAAMERLGSDNYGKSKHLRLEAVSTPENSASRFLVIGDDGTYGRSQQRVLAPTSANCAEKIEQQEPMPDELEINGQRYQKARFLPCLIPGFCSGDPIAIR